MGKPMEMDRAGRPPEKKKFHLLASTACLLTTEQLLAEGNFKRITSAIPTALGHIEPIGSFAIKQKLRLIVSEP
jgi:hypothetical protein